MDEKVKELIVLKNDQQTTIAIGFSRKGKSTIEPGDKISVASSAVTILSAQYNPETKVIDVVPVEGAEGPADVMVTVTLADGTVLPMQTVEFDVKHRDADAVTLKPGSIGEKKTIIVVPQPNDDPHIVPAPADKPAAAKAKDPPVAHGATGAIGT
jgi:hypothetical protein